MAYKKTYIQKGIDVMRPVNANGLIVKSFSCPLFPDVKDIFTVNQPDVTGVTEVQGAIPYFKAYNMTMDMAYIGAEGTQETAVASALSYVASGEFSILDTYRNIGKRCRYAGFDGGKYVNRGGIESYEFAVTLKVNNPVSYGVYMPKGELGAYSVTDVNVYWSNGTTGSYVAGELIEKDLGTEGFGIFVPVGDYKSILQRYGLPRMTTVGDYRVTTDGYLRFTTIG